MLKLIITLFAGISFGLAWAWMDKIVFWLENIGMSNGLAVFTVDAYVTSIIILFVMLLEHLIKRMLNNKKSE